MDAELKSLRHEQARLRSLVALDVLDSAPEPEFDALVRVAALVCGAPISLVSLVDESRQWFKANIGLQGVTQTSRDIAFCAHAIRADGLFEIPDAAEDMRFVENPLVTGEPHIRFYAGAPIRLRDGMRVGTLCVIDREPRTLTKTQRDVLVQLSIAAAQALECRMAARKLQEATRLLQVTLQSIADAVITTNESGIVTWLNPVAERMTGWLNNEARGRPIAQVYRIIHEDTREISASPVDACISSGAVASLVDRTILIAQDGEEFGIEDSAAPIFGEGADLLGVVLVFHDVTEQRRLTGEMSHQATHDALTGLTNRADFEARLARILAKANKEKSNHALMFIDLDQFKLVNDACGHSAGDQLLKQLAKLLQDSVRARDTVARLGGDEFAVILENCTSEQAERTAQQICDRVDEFRFIHKGRRFRIGTSIGLVPLDRRWSAPAAALQAADTACYVAKEEGRNRVHVWFDTDAAMHVRHGETHWASRLEQAVDDDRFVLYAQRIVPLQSASAGLHAEVLLRMVDDDGSLIAPGTFLPAAERFHLASRIDRWVLHRVVSTLLAHPNLSSIDMLCVNLSGQSIGDRVFLRNAVELLSTAGPDVCKRLCLEITETAAVTNITDAAQFVGEVRALGVRVALDDFGAGASSFGYLKSLAVDLLKIDGQFVRDVMEDPLDDAAVRCFVDVARVVGVKTVAEFIDKPNVLARMKELGVDYGQGFLLHRPEAIGALMRGTAVNIVSAIGERLPDARAAM